MQIIKKQIIISVLVLVLSVITSCKKYLDVVPDNIATIDNAFSMRSQAEKYLYTCYSYMPKSGNVSGDPAMFGGDEIWALENGLIPFFNRDLFKIALGYQNVVSPIYGSLWSGMYRGLRDCNIFLENIDRVPDLDEVERKAWIAEVKTLKAYYHFYLMKMYGPIPLVKVNLSIEAAPDEIRVSRSPVDSCFNYVVQLLDEAKEDLPLIITDPSKELGRITKPIAYALKAKVLVTAASPLFNGNKDQQSLKNNDGTQLFNQAFSKEKWLIAAAASKEAIEIAHQSGAKLFKYQPGSQPYQLTDTIETQLSIQGSFNQRWNSEIIWANTQSPAVDIQKWAFTGLNSVFQENYTLKGELAPPLKIAEMFYSENGVPITEDIKWNKENGGYSGRFELRTSGKNDKLYIMENSVSAAVHFDREPRFYADVVFDGSIYYGHGRYDDSKASELFYWRGLKKPVNTSSESGTLTGYTVKKVVHYQNVEGTGTNYSITYYPWPLIRLSDLYLLYAEALNEGQGPGAEVYSYINLIRERAGLLPVQDSWTQFSSNPTKFQTQEGMREIIQRERLIELAFEGQRFWDLRRWKTADQELNKPITGWDIAQETPALYYRERPVFDQQFGMKDYFWPIADSDIVRNRNLVQNLGW